MLALRTGLPLFSLAAILTFARLSDYFHEIPVSFFILAVFILAISIYFIFYMIYRGFDEQITDPITHTFTRQKVISLLKQDILYNAEYSVVLISVQNLSDINARYGTSAGDNVLKYIAVEIANFFQSKDFNKFPIGHFKGGDFLLGLKGDQNCIRPFLEMMSIKFDDIMLNDIEIKLTTAVVDKSLSTDIMALTDRLFELSHKESEYNVSSSANDDISLLELEQNVRYAIENKSISLKFQPIQADEKIAQISIKLEGKDKKIIHQKTFMPVVKRLGFERQYDVIVLEKVLSTCRKVKDMSFAFRLSPSVIRNRRFMTSFKQMLKKEKVDANRLMILLSEKEVYSNMKRYNELLQEYREAGVRFVLDDIGSLNSSVEYIKRIKVDIIRFDKTFSKHLDSEVYKSLLNAYIQVAKDLNMKSWIKMVDNENSKIYFENLHVDYIQGNIISKIINIDTLMEQT